ncbi:MULTISPECIES: hypothetical protein [unclassified Pseudomonas]|jgi:hypothetical protein|uniref:hypothetical protein n=1 Tax=unclassified Pseudomonas TaxID=196821 RepID=UPI002A369F26|nr:MULTISPECIES: hypothetical protein [unclassified Pseudomonas]MDX9668952.1 hypothetical protein [Pseudomonas sp. P8_250]WPN36996.1 hypothetical protein QMK53_04920 [Pseudomonas sp. P8_139]WPN41203.1 hypothetical protein QMK55_26460 [Pseudomonas sp. P8_229]
MNRIPLGIIVLLLGAGLAHADIAAPPPSLLLAQSPTGTNNNPYNSPIRRANPNSMQGTQPNAPAIRGPNTAPVPSSPTVGNGGIGNGQQQRSVPSTPPKFIPNPPPRDADSNR